MSEKLPSGDQTQNSPLGPIIALGAFGLYATHDVIVKTLGSTYSVFQILFFSGLFSFPLVVLMLMHDRRAGTLRAVHPWWSLLRAVTSVLSAACVFYAFTVLPLAQTYSMLFAMPLLVTLLSVPMLGEHVGLRRGLAVLVGLVGVMIVLRPGVEPISLGHVAAIFAAFGIALTMIVIRKIGREERSAVLMLYPLIGNLALMALLMPGVYVPMELTALGLSAVLAVLSFAAGLLLIAAYRKAEATLVAPMQYSQMLWAIFYGAFLFSETPDGWTLLGAALVIVSGIYVLLREARAKTSTELPLTRRKMAMTRSVELVEKQGDETPQ